MDQTLVIGKEKSDSTQYLFNAIRWVRPNNQEHILVGGSASNSIRIYNAQGKFIRSMGRRGRGPGEFYELTSVDVTDDNQVVVLDRRQSRVSFFDPNGELMRTENVKLSPMSSSHLFATSLKKDFFVVARIFSDKDKEVDLLHHYDSSFKQLKGSYLNTYQFYFDSLNALHAAMSRAPFFKATVFGKNHIAVVPRVYTGAIAVLNTTSLKEKRFGKPIDDFVTEYDWNTRHRYTESDETGFGSSSGQSGQYFYKRKGSNFGLVGNINFLLHFYGLFEEDDIIPYMKIYASDGELLKTIELSKHGISFISEQATFSRIPHFLDENNMLYIGDYRYKGSYPAVRVFKTNLDELLQ